MLKAVLKSVSRRADRTLPRLDHGHLPADTPLRRSSLLAGWPIEWDLLEQTPRGAGIVAKKSWIDALVTGSKKDGSGSWWSSSAGKGHQTSRRTSDGGATHYRHADGKVEGWTKSGKTGKYTKWSK
jgi:hypothetical protein